MTVSNIPRTTLKAIDLPPHFDIPRDLEFDRVSAQIFVALDFTFDFYLAEERVHKHAIDHKDQWTWATWRLLPNWLHHYGWLQTTAGNGVVYHATPLAGDVLERLRLLTAEMGKEWLANRPIQAIA